LAAPNQDIRTLCSPARKQGEHHSQDVTHAYFIPKLVPGNKFTADLQVDANVASRK
jgi:hypothetical protein